MTRAELERAVTQPAAHVGLAFEPGLAERILDDVGDEPGHLPLLEFVLRRLWEERHHGQLLHEAYEKMGGLHGAVAHKAEQFYSRLSSSNQEAIQRVFLQLVRPGETGEDTRRRERLADIPESSRELVKQLADERLLVTSTAAESADETVEVAHEALIRHWDLLKNWLSRDREFLLWRDRLRTLVAEWQRNARNKNSLLRGPALAEARRWLDERKRDLTDLERQFIKSSLQIQRRSRRVRVAIVVIILVLVAAGVGLIEADYVRVRAAVIYVDLKGVSPFHLQSATGYTRWTSRASSTNSGIPSLTSLAPSCVYGRYWMGSGSSLIKDARTRQADLPSVLRKSDSPSRRCLLRLRRSFAMMRYDATPSSTNSSRLVR